jgi:glycosyltransferase involved in cell wall biosynthesis
MSNILAAYPQTTLGLFGVMANPNEILAEYPSEIRTRISVVPAYDNKDLVDLLREYHILAFPSIVEGFGIAPLEAMACGLVPVVSATAGPMSYIENGRNGIIVPVRDAHALENGIAALLKDAPRWRELRAAALKTAVQYSYESIACELERVYIASRPKFAVPSALHGVR